MNKLYHAITLIILVFLPYTIVLGGNEDRSGEAGAGELLINPWSRGSGIESANTGFVKGLEGIFSNVGGLARTNSSELVFCRTYWLKGSDIHINAFGLAQRINEKTVLGFAVTSMSFGEIPIITVDIPEGGIGTFKPNFMNFNLAYSRAFSEHIYGGATVKIIYESVSDVHAQGAAIDAGIQYVTGKQDKVKFGITLKNVGPKLSFKGNGISYRGTISGSENTMTLEQRSAEYELPSLIKIGGSYDIFLNNEDKHKITLAGTFTANSFTKDQYALGLEYSLSSVLFVRCGYTFEKDMFDKALRTSAHTGLGAGFSIDIPMNKDKDKHFGFDYSYRATNPFSGTHCIGARISI